MRPLRIATRASRLALTQSGQVAEQVRRVLGARVELLPLKTSGDRLAGVDLSRLGGKGLFVKELEEALLAGRAELAVHSTKDLPARLPEGLALAVFPKRADPRDALVARRRGARLADLAPGARVGTGSLRRGAQLRALRPDLEILPLRGNVTTRLRRLEAGDFDAVILACAGLERLGLAERIDERIDPGELLPAVGQGALALEVRADAPFAAELASLDDPPTSAAVRAERAFLTRLEGDCNVPLAALGVRGDDGRVALRGLVAAPAGDRIARGRAEDSDPETAGRRVADQVLEAGGAAILAALAQEARA